MSPPTEQLIRDYLNRLSVAARGRLATEDRNALLLRTRDFIERNANAAGAATSGQVASFLSRLGDPAELVSQALARLAAVRGEAPPEPPAERRRLGKPRASSRQASWHWPRPPGSADLQARLLRGLPGQQGAAQPTAVSGVAARPAAASAPENSQAELDSGEQVNGAVYAEPPIWVPRQSPRQADRAAELVGGPDRAGEAVTGGALRSGRSAPTPGATAGPEPARPVAEGEPERVRDGAEQEPVAAGAGPLLGGQPAGTLAASMVDLARRHPAEALAVTLLGLGGAAFPPVWLLGVIAALPCKAWDYRDKWIGLAGPVLLLIVGTVAGMTLTSGHVPFGSYVHEAWVYANITSRLAALLGASYLWRRVMQGKRAPPVPPWNRPRRIS